MGGGHWGALGGQGGTRTEPPCLGGHLRRVAVPAQPGQTFQTSQDAGSVDICRKSELRRGRCWKGRAAPSGAKVCGPHQPVFSPCSWRPVFCEGSPCCPSGDRNPDNEGPMPGRAARTPHVWPPRPAGSPRLVWTPQPRPARRPLFLHHSPPPPFLHPRHGLRGLRVLAGRQHRPLRTPQRFFRELGSQAGGRGRGGPGSSVCALLAATPRSPGGPAAPRGLAGGCWPDLLPQAGSRAPWLRKPLCSLRWGAGPRAGPSLCSGPRRERGPGPSEAHLAGRPCGGATTARAVVIHHGGLANALKEEGMIYFVHVP